MTTIDKARQDLALAHRLAVHHGLVPCSIQLSYGRTRQRALYSIARHLAIGSQQAFGGS